MSIMFETQKPPFYAVVYTSAGNGGGDTSIFGETASMLVALAAMQPGYLGFQTELAAEGRTVAVCYWDHYGAMAEWKKEAALWTPAKPGLDAFVCATGCLWPWLLEDRQINLETAARSVA